MYKKPDKLIIGVDTGIANTGLACACCKETLDIKTKASMGLDKRLALIDGSVERFVLGHYNRHSIPCVRIVTEELFIQRKAMRSMVKNFMVLGALCVRANNLPITDVELIRVVPLHWIKFFKGKYKHDKKSYVKRLGYKVNKKKGDDHTTDAALLAEYYRRTA